MIEKEKMEVKLCFSKRLLEVHERDDQGNRNRGPGIALQVTISSQDKSIFAFFYTGDIHVVMKCRAVDLFVICPSGRFKG